MNASGQFAAALAVLSLISGCVAGEGCACATACWGCKNVGTDALVDERPEYTTETVLRISTGTWQGEHPDGASGKPLHLTVTVRSAEGSAAYRMARLVGDAASCEIPISAVEQCKAMIVPANVGIFADPDDFSATVSSITTYGDRIDSTGSPREARRYDGFPSASWDGPGDLPLTLLFSEDERLWLSVSGSPFAEIGERL